MKSRTSWGKDAPRLVKQGKMGFFVGNGLSRLCGAPSWGELFNDPDVLEVLEKERVGRNTPYLELGYLLSSRDSVIWERTLRRLFDWANGPVEGSRAHRALLQVLRPEKYKQRFSMLTTNVDSLLETHGYQRKDVGYVHGVPDKHTEWIFAADKYWDSWNRDDGIKQVFKAFQPEGVLFLGYGHSHEDFDIVQTVIELRKQYYGNMYTLMPRRETEQGDLRCRLQWQGVKIIPYDVPLDPTPLERELFLTRALLDLAEDSGRHQDPASQSAYAELQTWCEQELSSREQRRSNAAVVLGLAGVNRHAALPGPIPTSERRVAESAEIRVEAGGPGYIVSAIARATGTDSFLVSKIALDPQGELVREAIQSSGNARIFADFVEAAPAGPGVIDFRTWDSFILEPSDQLSHRVFIDRKIDGSELDISHATKNAVTNMLRDGSRRTFYFDRHFRDAAVHLLRSAQHRSISENVWTVYETDSDGGRYGFKDPGTKFDKRTAYDFEKRLAADPLQCINVVTASFRFARDCLAGHYGNMPRDSYAPLVSVHDTPDIVEPLGVKPTRTEDEILAELVVDPDRLKAFADAVRKGADRFLRRHPLRLVVVTLHRLGSFAITVPADATEAAILCYVDGIRPDGERLYTASAGDVFRGVLVSALAHAQRHGLEARDIMKKEFIEPLLMLSNRCAAEKVKSPTVIDSLDAIKRYFDEWAKQPAMVAK